MSNIESLLNEVNLISKKYEEIAKITGENFNIFQTLGLEYAELKHSKIIAELLNPQGSHGMGNEFLKLLLSEIGISEFQKFKDIEIKTEKKKEDGQIDIFIKGKEAEIVIENKIRTVDKEGQLEKYRRLYKDALIIYLTLNGNKPSNYEANDPKLKLMSYKNDIINWLERCKEKSVNIPYLRETIAQYINLLKFLTGQTRRKDMSSEIVEAVLKSPENVKAAFEIAANANGIKEKIALELFVPAVKELAAKYDLNIYPDCPGYWGIFLGLGNKLLQENQIKIGFEFQQYNLGRLGYGLKNETQDIANPESSLRKRIKASETTTDWWLFYKELHLPLEELMEKSKVMEICEEKIKELLDMIKGE